VGFLYLACLAQIFVAKIENGIIGTDEIPMSSSNADSGNLFRYEGDKYIYNLSTDTLSPGTWQIKASLNDGRNYTVIILLQ